MCNITCEDIIKEFKENTGIDSDLIQGIVPCEPPYHDTTIRYGIVVLLKNDNTLIYISKSSKKKENEKKIIIGGLRDLAESLRFTANVSLNLSNKLDTVDLDETIIQNDTDTFVRGVADIMDHLDELVDSGFISNEAIESVRMKNNEGKDKE